MSDRWIPVGERLPARGICVDVWMEDVRVPNAMQDPAYGYWYILNEDNSGIHKLQGKVTYWMLKPFPPEDTES